MLHHGSVWASLKKKKKISNSNPSLDALLISIAFHNNIYIFIIIITAFSFFTAYSRIIYSMEEVMSVRLYGNNNCIK